MEPPEVVASRSTVHKSYRWVTRAFHCIVLVLGVLSCTMLVLAFTSIPFKAHRWLGTGGGLAGKEVDAIIILSGSGMPSGPELMRCHEGAARARQAPNAEVLLALPMDSALARAMVQELGLRGITPARITLLMHGRSTREQALDLVMARPAWKTQRLALVTAPENMYRSLLTFRKLGFKCIAGAPVFDHALYTNLAYSHRSAGGKSYTPDMSSSVDLRYNFWNHLKLEITCLREYMALAYYRWNGWV